MQLLPSLRRLAAILRSVPTKAFGLKVGAGLLLTLGAASAAQFNLYDTVLTYAYTGQPRSLIVASPDNQTTGTGMLPGVTDANTTFAYTVHYAMLDGTTRIQPLTLTAWGETLAPSSVPANNPTVIGDYSYLVQEANGTIALTGVMHIVAFTPFAVPYRTAPTDATARWAGFTPRVGTYLPTDPYHFWRIDLNNRAEAQDAYWRIEAVAATTPFAWTGSIAALNPGTTSQAWRNAELRVLNLHRYYYGTWYVTENPDWQAACQAAAFVEGTGAKFQTSPLTHHLTLADMPAGFAYADLAITGAASSNMGWAAGDIAGYIADFGPSNYTAGHRRSLLSPSATAATTADVPNTTGGILNALHITTGAAGTYPAYRNPFAQPLLTFPYRGYNNVDMFDYYETPFSVDLAPLNLSNMAGVYQPASELRVTVLMNGVPVPVTDINNVAIMATFVVHHGNLLPLTATGDVTFDITVEGVRYTPNPYPYGPNDGNVDLDVLQPHTLHWTAKVYDPLVVLPVGSSTHSPIMGLSTRAAIGQGDNVMIAGINISGTEPLRVAFRAQGPSLATAGIQHPATNPSLEIYRQSDGQSLGANDNWRDGVNWRLVQSYGFNPVSDLDSVAIATLPPGLYTAVVRDIGAGGVGIVEAYATDAQSTSRLSAVSTRGIVGLGENVMIAGIITQTTETLVFRTQGPSLTAYGVAGVVNATHLKIYNQATGQVIYENAGWQVAGNARLLPGGDLSSFAPGSPREAALVVTLPAGAYTATVEPSDGTPGVGIVEVYEAN